MNTKLTIADVKYLQDKQYQLDSEIMKAKNINLQEWINQYQANHNIALKLELAEFVNECYDVWKYWKSKPIDRKKLLNEAIDVVHFVFLNLNKIHSSLEDKFKSIDDYTESANRYIGDTVKVHHLEQLVSEDYNTYYVLGFVLTILDRYGFTTKDIIDEYNEKNKENFSRLESGY